MERTRVVAICSGFILFAAGFWAGNPGCKRCTLRTQ